MERCGWRWHRSDRGHRPLVPIDHPLVTDTAAGGCGTRSTLRILNGMTTPIPTRFSDQELALIDELVAEGVGESRSAVIRRGVHHLADAVRRANVGADIARSYRDLPQSSEDDDLAMASAIAITEAEPW